MNPEHPRIISLIPSATEIVAALGLIDFLVGRSHECDYPPEVRDRPICTRPKFDLEGSSAEIHNRVTTLLQSALSVYAIELDTLKSLQPTHILTQAQCDVCGVSLSEVEEAVASFTEIHPTIISLEPSRLTDALSDIYRVAEIFDVDIEELGLELKMRIDTCAQKTQLIPESDRPTVACIEWTDPLMAAGNWIPELVNLAGGRSLFGEVGKHSPRLDWSALCDADPDVIVLLPCGYDLKKTIEEAQALAQRPEWPTLKAVQTERVYATDGNHYFNRPGPRLVDSLEILAEILHPELFNFGYQEPDWQPIAAYSHSKA
jgi:iron complex transport system substrate-binding protein